VSVVRRISLVRAVLDAKQKKAFDTGGRIGSIFDWWGKK
jgi:hypothetical protein